MILEPIVSMTTQQPMMTDRVAGISHYEIAQLDERLDNDAIWDSFPELEDLFYGVPPEQWLMPSVALWNASPASRNNPGAYPRT